MKKRDIRFASIPSTEEVAAERERLAYQSRYQRVLRSTIYIPVSYTHLTLPTNVSRCRSRWSPYH